MLRNVRPFIIGSALIILCAACGGGGGGGGGGSTPPPQTPPPQTTPQGCSPVSAATQSSDSLAGIVDAAAIAELKARNIPGMTVAVAKKGTILYSQAYGYADVASCRPMKVSDSMQIGSVTKQFTASAILQLQEAGLIDLDHTVVSYLPQYSFDPRVTVRMLLNQTSGLADYLEFPSLQQYALSGASESIVLNEMAKAALIFEPGTAFYYSNTNYYILGSIIEAVSSQNYSDYLSAKVFPLAGLTHTSSAQPSDAASPYGTKSVGGDYAGIILPPSVYFAAGQLWSNVQDLALWDDAWLSAKVVSQASVDLMRTPPAVNYYQTDLASDYGMGWLTHSAIAGHPFIWHNGQSTSYTSFNGLLTDSGLSLTILANYTVDDAGPPLLNVGEQIVGAICNSPAAGGC